MNDANGGHRRTLRGSLNARRHFNARALHLIRRSAGSSRRARVASTAAMNHAGPNHLEGRLCACVRARTVVSKEPIAGIAPVSTG